MKIICIGRNYADHAKEMNSPVPKEPIFFMKPDTALHRETDFYLPDFTKDLQHEIEVDKNPITGEEWGWSEAYEACQHLYKADTAKQKAIEELRIACWKKAKEEGINIFELVEIEII